MLITKYHCLYLNFISLSVVANIDKMADSDSVPLIEQNLHRKIIPGKKNADRCSWITVSYKIFTVTC